MTQLDSRIMENEKGRANNIQHGSQERPDPEYAEAFNQGVAGYATDSKNPYPKGNLQTHSWEECRKYLGWNDGYFHAPYFK